MTHSSMSKAMAAVWARQGDSQIRAGTQNMRRSLITIVRASDNLENCKAQLAMKAAHDVKTADRYYDYTEGYARNTVAFNKKVRECIYGG